MNSPESTRKRGVILTLLKLPADFLARGDASPSTLLVESGYLAEHEAIQADDIERELQSRPERVAEWLQYSDDKRSSAGWYLKRSADGKWVVGHVGKAGRGRPESIHESAVKACSVFIKNEIEEMRGTGLRAAARTRAR